MDLRQLERALEVIRRCKQGADRAASPDDHVRWSNAASELDQALRARGYKGTAAIAGTYDERLERAIEQAHALAP